MQLRICSIGASLLCALSLYAQTAPTLAVDANQNRHPISPYIYGINDKDPGDTHTTVRRLGGNRMTGYNWTNNATNAGNDWHHFSDDWMCAQNLGFHDCDQPGSSLPIT